MINKITLKNIYLRNEDGNFSFCLTTIRNISLYKKIICKLQTMFSKYLKTILANNKTSFLIDFSNFCLVGWNCFQGWPILWITREPQPDWCCQCFSRMSLLWCEAWLPCSNYQSTRRGKQKFIFTLHLSCILICKY